MKPVDALRHAKTALEIVEALMEEAAEQANGACITDCALIAKIDEASIFLDRFEAELQDALEHAEENRL